MWRASGRRINTIQTLSILLNRRSICCFINPHPSLLPSRARPHPTPGSAVRECAQRLEQRVPAVADVVDLD
eukprot:SAG11_NODE_123_length_15805_cov_15.133261_4_plen_71_part_00